MATITLPFNSMNTVLFDHLSNEIFNLMKCDSLFKYRNVYKKEIYGWQRRQAEITIIIITVTIA